MSRKAAVVPNRRLETTLPPDLAVKLDLLLWSDVEGKIPFGAIQQLITLCLRRYFEDKELDLAPFLSSYPGVHTIRAPAHTLSALLTHLKGDPNDPETPRDV